MKPPTNKRLDIRDTLEWLLSLSPWGRPAPAKGSGNEVGEPINPNLRQGLEWLLGQSGPEESSADEGDLARQERRVELLLWLLNLEKRLPPYGDEQPA